MVPGIISLELVTFNELCKNIESVESYLSLDDAIPDRHAAAGCWEETERILTLVQSPSVRLLPHHGDPRREPHQTGGFRSPDWNI